MITKPLIVTAGTHSFIVIRRFSEKRWERIVLDFLMLLFLQIPEKSCQLRAVCEFSADPGRYFPLSDIILSKITDDRPEYGHNNYQFSRRRNAPVSSFDLYKQSYEDGSTFGAKKCAELYDKVCKYSMDKLLNMPVLKFWNKLQSNLQLKFEDASEFT